MCYCKIHLANIVNGTGSSTAGTSSQGPTVDGVPNDYVSQHQARLQAAASAAALYEKSFVYPSPNAVIRYRPYYKLSIHIGFLLHDANLEVFITLNS